MKWQIYRGISDVVQDFAQSVDVIIVHGERVRRTDEVLKVWHLTCDLSITYNQCMRDRSFIV